MLRPSYQLSSKPQLPRTDVEHTLTADFVEEKETENRVETWAFRKAW